MAFNLRDITRAIWQDQPSGPEGWNLGDIEQVLRSGFQKITEIVLDGEEVSIPKFGTFRKAITKPARRRNFRTGDIFESPGGKVKIRLKSSSSIGKE